MALSTLRTNFSGLFKSKDTVEINPQLYLKLTTKCMKQADKIVASGAATSPKFNQEQCKYLVDKLKVAVRSAHSFLEPIKSWYSKSASGKDRALSLEIFKLLFALGKEVENFVQDCSKDAWIQSAIMLTNMSDYTLSLSFHLEFVTIVFFGKSVEFGAMPALPVVEVIASTSQAEGEIVEAKANQDQLRLYEDVSALIQSSKARSADQQQARFLLQRLRSQNLHQPSASSLQSNQSSCPEISMSSLKQAQVLGKGAFGTVHKVNWLGTEVARKTFHGPSAPEFNQEVNILEGLCHPNIVSLYWHTRGERKCYTIMELMDGDLFLFMQERLECGTRASPFNISEAVHIMLQVAEGMLFLHDKQIVHRDLKSHNILVKKIKARGVEVDYVQVKVADFGLSRTKERSMTYTNQTQNQGTTRWMAPEMIKTVEQDGHAEVSKVDEELKYPFKVDVYSFGMVCFEILTGDLPFPTLSPHEVKKKVLEGARPQLPDQCPKKLRLLIEACWSSEPKQRPRFYHICAELRHLKCTNVITSARAWYGSGDGVKYDVHRVFEEIPSNDSGHLTQIFSFKELDHATQGFGAKQELGGGGFGTVYRGKLTDGRMVAVKKLNQGGSQGIQQFLNEVEVLSKVRHPHLVQLLGCCMERPLLVYEFVPNGSISNHLHGGYKADFPWDTRLEIAIQTAEALAYLHFLVDPPIFHMDVKTTNILLDKNFKAKLAGFGLSKLVVNMENTHISTAPQGTPGYLDPDYHESYHLSDKSDVYSFGVVLMELVTAKKAVDMARERKEINLASLAVAKIHSGSLHEIIDPDLMGLFPHYPEAQVMVEQVAELAFRCLAPEKDDRPSMKEVLAELQRIQTIGFEARLKLETNSSRYRRG